MSRYADDSREQRLDTDSFAQGFFQNAVYRHWDPYEDIPQADLEADREKLLDGEITEEEFEEMRTSIAMFGAGEEAVTEDLAPLSLVLDDIDDQMFVSSQIYEEAKHTQFFDRYWREVIDPVADELGVERTAPTDDRYFNDAYETLFDAVEETMHRLLDEDTPENRVEAYCHYHLVVESVLAQTGYYGLQSAFSEHEGDDISLRDTDDIEYDRLDGLVDGITFVRSDEGRHVGWGMHKVRGHIQEDGVDPQLVHDTLNELLPHVVGILQYTSGDGIDPTPLVEYSQNKLTRRIEILTDMDATVPPVEELVRIEGVDDARAD